MSDFNKHFHRLSGAIPDKQPSDPIPLLQFIHDLADSLPVRISYRTMAIKAYLASLHGAVKLPRQNMTVETVERYIKNLFDGVEND